MNRADAPIIVYVTCPCRHCGGNIEFDANCLAKGETCAVPCPHCGLETILSLQSNSPTANLPTPRAVAPIPQPFLLTIGDIGITSDRVVTPNGSGPLAGSQWICTDMSRTETRIPPVAIILAIVGALLCLIGLLFLLMKEHVTTGYVEVSVRTGDIYHKVQLPVIHPAQVAQIRQQVNKAQSMAAQAAR
jgi:hypothetical protein